MTDPNTQYPTISFPTTYSSIQPDGTLRKKLWQDAVNTVPLPKAILLTASILFFIYFNINQNSYSLIGYFGEPDLVIALLIFLGLGTFISNGFTKFNDIIKPVDALKLDKKQAEFAKHFLKTLEVAASLHPEKTVLYLDSSYKTSFYSTTNLTQQPDVASSSTGPVNEKLVKLIQLGQHLFNHLTGETLSVVDSIDDSTLDERTTLITDTDIIHDLNQQPKHTLRFYSNGWTQRITHDFKHTPLSQALATTIKAGLALTGWVINIGAPSLLVILQGVEALSKNDKTEKISNTAARTTLLLFNLSVAAAKMYINLGLKQDLANRRTREIAENLWHGEIRTPESWKISALATLISLPNFLVVLATGFFFSGTGLVRLSEELNIFGISSSPSASSLKIITLLSVVTSLPTAYATALRPVYDELTKITDKKEPHGTRSVSMPWSFIYYLSNIVDAATYGVNSGYIMHKTFETICEHYPDSSLADFIEENPAFTVSFSAITGIFCSFVMFAWAHHKGKTVLAANVERLQAVSGALFNFSKEIHLKKQSATSKKQPLLKSSTQSATPLETINPENDNHESEARISISDLFVTITTTTGRSVESYNWDLEEYIAKSDANLTLPAGN